MVPGQVVPAEDVLIVDGSGPDFPDEALLGSPADVMAGPRGEIVVLDHRPVEVKIFAADGSFLRAFGRLGSGPGEFEMPWRLPVLNRQQISVAESMRGRVTFLDFQGGYLGRLDLPFTAIKCIAAAPKGGYFLTRRLSEIRRDGSLYAGIVLHAVNARGESVPFELSGGPQDTLEIVRRLYSRDDPYGHYLTNRKSLLRTPDGSILAAGASYTFYRITERGRIFGFRRVAERVRYPDWWFDYWIEWYRERGRLDDMPTTIGFIPVPNSMAVDERGHLWVMPNDGTKWSFASSYEEFDRSNLVPLDEFDVRGRWLRQVVVELPAGAVGLFLTDAAHGCLYGLTFQGPNREVFSAIRFHRPD